ncbi:MAG: hypothetical protein AB1796_02695 [Bacillota bacterium]
MADLNPMVLSLLQEINAELEAIWLTEPPDLQRFRLGLLDTGAGVDNQYFTVWVMLGSEVRNLGVHSLADLRVFAVRQEFTLEMLKMMTRQMTGVGRGVIGYFGLKRYGELLNKFVASLDEVKAREEYCSLLDAMFTLTNRYQLWLHQTFPWYLAVHFPKVTPEQLRESLQLTGADGSAFAGN